jgi:transposase
MTDHDMNTNTSKTKQITPIDKPQKARPEHGRVKGPTVEQPADHIKIGVDVGLRKYAVCRQVDGSLQEPAQMKSPEIFKEWVLKQKTLAKKVTVCYEAGLFGFALARWLVEQQIDCLVMAPMRLDEKGRRVENDKLNSRDIGSRLDRYLAGNTRALTVCRIPTLKEELARHQTRLRQQLLDHRNSLDAQGRSLLWEFGELDYSSRWWQSPQWERIGAQVQSPIVEGLSVLRSVILELNDQLEKLEKKLLEQSREALPKELAQLPLGVGALTMLVLTREIMDWKRFKNRQQVGCFTGLVPSESTTGESFRQGSVTKVGNPVIRATLVEMTWRMVRFQPDCHALKRWMPILGNKKAGGSVRKKAIVAAARQMGVDMWRLATGQTTCEKLGLRVRSERPERGRVQPKEQPAPSAG